MNLKVQEYINKINAHDDSLVDINLSNLSLTNKDIAPLM